MGHNALQSRYTGKADNRETQNTQPGTDCTVDPLFLPGMNTVLSPGHKGYLLILGDDTHMLDGENRDENDEYTLFINWIWNSQQDTIQASE